MGKDLEELIDQADTNFIGFPGSREYQPDFVQQIIKDHPDMQYGGTYYLPKGNNNAFANMFKKDPITSFDIIMPKNVPRHKVPVAEIGPVQQIFYTIAEFAHIRQAPAGKRTVYFIGELHDARGFIHWNVMIINRLKPDILVEWFDPGISAHDDVAYDFYSQGAIMDAITAEYAPAHVSLHQYKAKDTPQFVCLTGSRGTDIFCQSWVLLFLDIYVNNLVEPFLALNFKHYQTQIIKYWLICFLTTIGQWQEIIKRNPSINYQKYFPLCINVKQQGLDNIYSITSIPACSTGDCAKNVIKLFSK